MRNKWEAFKKKSAVFIVVAVWMVMVSLYNLFAVIIHHGAFSILGLAIGALVLTYMWGELENTEEKPYKRYHG